MSFLQPWMLLALPLIAFPIIIHLVNQMRFQNVPWAAMMFLLQATKMSSGYTKLRQWIILAMRTLAVGSLVFFTARPLASGLMGMMGTRSNEISLLLIDRSPSMQEKPTGSGLSKLDSALMQVSNTMKTLGLKQVVVFDSAREQSLELDSPDKIANNPLLGGHDLSSDIPGLLERALVYVKNNNVGSVNIWICSDLRESDWKSRDGRWAATREGFLGLPQEVRFHVLDLSVNAKDDLAIRILHAKRVQGAEEAELSLSFRIERPQSSSPDAEPGVHSLPAIQVPVEIEIGDARSVLNVDLQSNTAEVNDYRIALANEKLSSKTTDAERGWGRVSIPADSNMANNNAYFVYEKPATRKSVIVSSNAQMIEAISLGASIAPEQSIQCATETVSASQLDSVDWNSISMVIWHDQLPDGRSFELLSQFVEDGGQILFFPPESPNDREAFGIRWKNWELIQNQTAPTANESDSSILARVQQWRNDSELLGNTLNGAPLPVGQLGIKRACRVQGEGTVLAAIRDDLPLLIRIDSASTERSGLYVCTTTPSVRDSTLATDGIVMYIALQRVLAAGSARIASAKMVTLGELKSTVFERSTQESGATTVLSNQHAEHAGVYRKDELLIAQNRHPDEDQHKIVSGDTLSSLFGNLNWTRINSGASANSLVQEIWRWFVFAMLLALVIEAILCIPRRRMLPVRA